jgi:hypothetical protein
MMFLHVSTENTIISKDNFVRPKLDTVGTFKHSFCLDNGFHLSKSYSNGESMWLDYCKFQIRPRPPSSIRKKGKIIGHCDFNPEEQPWLKPDINKQYFDVDFDKHKIYVMSSATDLIDFFSNYGFYRRSIRDYKENLRYIHYLKNLIIIDFLKTVDNMFQYFMKNQENINHLKNIRNKRNMSLVKIIDDKVIIPKKGITPTFLVDVLRTQDYFEKIIGNSEDFLDKVETYLAYIDYPKIKKAGYNGIYFSEELFEVNDDIKKEFIKKPNIGTFPNIFSNFRECDRLKTKDAIEDYIVWLGSDTLVLWDWIF